MLSAGRRLEDRCAEAVGDLPQGSMYPNSIYCGHKVIPILVLWGLRIYCLGTWTLRVSMKAPGFEPTVFSDSPGGLGGISFCRCDALEQGRLVNEP